MKKILFAVSAVALALSAGSAMAADLPSRKEAPVYVPPPPPPLWTGFYVGLNIGGGWDANGGQSGVSAYSDPRFAFGSTPFPNTTLGPNIFFLPNGNTLGSQGGVVGGAQAGYNFQFGQFVLGAETDFQGTSLSGGGNNSPLTLFPTPYPNLGGNNFLTPVGAITGANISLPWFGTVRGRAGYLVTPTFLVYGTAGFAYGDVQAWSFSNTRTGWTAGGGVEWMFAPHWSAKAEYLYVDLDSNGRTGTFGWTFGNRFHPQLNVVRVGVNYHFNFAAPAPVVAKY
ncbi:MAG TPA: outer membrane beta-barrel protein [Methylocystis sp.]